MFKPVPEHSSRASLLHSGWRRPVTLVTSRQDRENVKIAGISGVLLSCCFARMGVKTWEHHSHLERLAMLDT